MELTPTFVLSKRNVQKVYSLVFMHFKTEMKMFKRVAIKKIVIILLLLGVVITSALTYISNQLPDVGHAPKISVERTQKRIERGKYLALNVMACMDCHSEKQWNQFAPPIDTNHLGSGGELFGHEQGIPGRFVAANLTPFHLGDWTDGEIYRAITTGVSRDGRALFPVMPYLSYGQMDTEDIYSVIAYLRTLPKVENKVPAPVADFPMNFIIHTIPHSAAPQTAPSPSDKLAYGQYLVLAADCQTCHTADHGKAFGGGRAFKLGEITTYSANITSDREFGIGTWTEDEFIARFRAYANIKDGQPVEKEDFQTIMPWRQFGKMKEADLAAIYTYLRTVKPVNQENPRFKINRYQ
jgi:mono/diheme cytochrome c family protein